MPDFVVDEWHGAGGVSIASIDGSSHGIDASPLCNVRVVLQQLRKVSHGPNADDR